MKKIEQKQDVIEGPGRDLTDETEKLQGILDSIGTAGLERDSLDAHLFSKTLSATEVIQEMGWEGMDRTQFISLLADALDFQADIQSRATGIERPILDAQAVLLDVLTKNEVLDARFQKMLPELSQALIKSFPQITDLTLVIGGSVGIGTSELRKIIGEDLKLPDLDVAILSSTEISSETAEQVDAFIRDWLKIHSTEFGFPREIELCFEHTPKNRAYRMPHLSSQWITQLTTDTTGAGFDEYLRGEFASNILNYLLPSYPDNNQDSHFLREFIQQLSEEQYLDFEREVREYFVANLVSIKSKHIFNSKKLGDLFEEGLIKRDEVSREKLLRIQIFAQVVEKLCPKFLGQKYLSTVRELRTA